MTKLVGKKSIHATLLACSTDGIATGDSRESLDSELKALWLLGWIIPHQHSPHGGDLWKTTKDGDAALLVLSKLAED